jgi:hypothetical protein
MSANAAFADNVAAAASAVVPKSNLRIAYPRNCIGGVSSNQ